MKVTSIGLLVGRRSGSKDNKRWCSLVVDNPQDTLDRLVLYAPDKLIPEAEKLAIGSMVEVHGNLSPLRDGGYRFSLEGVYPHK